MTTLTATAIVREKYGAGHPEEYKFRAPLHVTVTHRERGLTMQIQGSDEDIAGVKAYMETLGQKGVSRVSFTKGMLERGSLKLLNHGETTSQNISSYTLARDHFFNDIEYTVIQPQRRFPRFWK